MALFQRSIMFGACVVSCLATAPSDAQGVEAESRIKAFCVDFNWGPDGFAPPGMYAQASAQKHFEWYRDVGVNTIQTFCVSCPGYAWYKSDVAPAQPGMSNAFLRIVKSLVDDAYIASLTTDADCYR